MKGLDWSNESFVRVVRADTPAWKRLRYEAQSVYLHLLRRLDRAGCMTLDGLLPYEAVAEMTGCPEDTAERALEKLFKAGFLAVNREEDLLYDPEFLAREEAPMSDALRKRESRARRRDRAAESRIVTAPSQNVTTESQNVTKPSRAVTRGHAASHSVTPILPSFLPSDPSVEKDGADSAPRPAGLQPPESWKDLGLGTTEAKALLTLLDLPERIDPAGKKSGKVTDEKAMRAERLHLLAWLFSRPSSNGADTTADLWISWRRKARRKGKRNMADTTDWRNEVETLRKLMQRPGQAYGALACGECEGWRGFEWTWMERESQGREAPKVQPVTDYYKKL